MHTQIALITGASQGIGKAVAIDLAASGYHVILIARNQEKLKSVCKEIIQQGGQASHYAVDVSYPEQIESCVNDIMCQHQRIDLLFNNAGINLIGTTDVTDQEIKQLLDINLLGAIYIAKYVALQMKRQRSGYIMNLSSLSGKISSANLGIYNASKFGLSGFSDALAKEMLAYGVKVTAICPGMVATDMSADFAFKSEWMIQVSDICKTVGYLLDLGTTALPTEVIINCTTYITNMVDAEARLFQDDSGSLD